MRARLAVFFAATLFGCGGGNTTAPRDQASPDGAIDQASPNEDATDAGPAVGDLAGDAPVRDADAPLDSSPADATCNTGCAPEIGHGFCQAGEVQWLCHTPGQMEQAFIGACRDAGTNAIRYCCPPTFMPMCQ